MIYFDHNSTTPLSDRAKQAMLEFMNAEPTNASSIHSFGRKAKMVLEDGRKLIAGNMSADKNYNLLFCASGTEANNLVLKNFYQDQIFISNIEHVSVLDHIKYCPSIKTINVDLHGKLDLEHLEDSLKKAGKERILLSVIYANNEPGVLQEMSAITSLAKQYGAFVHSDFSQVPGKLQCNLDETDLDFVTISAHKFGGPIGIAGLLYKKNLHLIPQIIGGGQEKGLRSGTENILGVVGMAAASYNENIKKDIELIGDLRQYLESKIKAICPQVKIASQKAPRLCNTSMIVMPNIESQLQIVSFDLKGVAVSSGSACSSGKIGYSHVLQALGFSQQDSRCAIRVSLASSNSRDEVDFFCQVWQEIFENNLNKK